LRPCRKKPTPEDGCNVNAGAEVNSEGEVTATDGQGKPSEKPLPPVNEENDKLAWIKADQDAARADCDRINRTDHYGKYLVAKEQGNAAALCKDNKCFCPSAEKSLTRRSSTCGSAPHWPSKKMMRDM